MGRLALVVAGNTVDFSEFYSENALTAQGNAGTYLYTFQRAIPENATGTWAVGIEGYQNVTLRNREGDLTVRNAGLNKVLYFPVTEAQAKPRRAVVALEKCNACHLSLEVHGSNRNNVEFCVLCHNPNQTDIARRTEAQLPAESVNFKVMIHKIHTGEELQIPYTVHGFGGTPFDFTEVRFPGERRDCTICHIDGTQNLPLQDGLLATTAPRDYLDPLPPISGACLSCHTSVAAAAHADVNTSAKLGEACSACHGSQAEFSVDRVHAR
jgi:OmcA/MtrC family decaheme c-type cytochrome